MDGVNALAFPEWEYREGTASSHHLLPGQWNEIHPFRQATREIYPGFEIGVGEFLNSENAQSLYAALKGQSGPFWAEGGLATGYSGAPVVPFGRVGMDLNNHLSLFAAPAYNADTRDLGAVLGLNVFNLEW